MSNLEMWALVVGFFLPNVIALVVQSGWSQRLQSVAAFVVCAVAAAGTAYFQGDLTGRRFVEAGLVILVTAVATYKGFWKPTGVASGIEAKSNLNSGP